MEIAEEEIERTSEEAVKAALVEVGGELAYEKERADLLEKRNVELEMKIEKLENEKKKKRNRFFFCTAAGGAAGAAIAAFVFTAAQGAAR